MRIHSTEDWDHAGSVLRIVRNTLLSMAPSEHSEKAASSIDSALQSITKLNLFSADQDTTLESY